MIKIGFVYIKGGTGKTVLASSAVLYLNAAAAPAGLIDASPVPMAALLLAAGTQPGVYAGREEVPVAVLRTPERLEEGYRALERLKTAIAVVDFPPVSKTPRLDVAVAVADPAGLHFLDGFRADASHVILAVNMADKIDVGRKDVANSVVALPYSPGVAKAYQSLVPPILPHHPKARRLGVWKKAFLALMEEITKWVRR